MRIRVGRACRAPVATGAAGAGAHAGSFSRPALTESEKMLKLSRFVRSGFFGRTLAAAAAGLAFAATASAATLYDANVPRYFTTTATDPIYFQVQDANRIMFDDVPVNYGTTGSPAAQ